MGDSGRNGASRVSKAVSSANAADLLVCIFCRRAENSRHRGLEIHDRRAKRRTPAKVQIEARA
jgi:hypothetical protein